MIRFYSLFRNACIYVQLNLLCLILSMLYLFYMSWRMYMLDYLKIKIIHYYVDSLEFIIIVRYVLFYQIIYLFMVLQSLCYVVFLLIFFVVCVYLQLYLMCLNLSKLGFYYHITITQFNILLDIMNNQYLNIHHQLQNYSILVNLFLF